MNGAEGERKRVGVRERERVGVRERERESGPGVCVLGGSWPPL